MAVRVEMLTGSALLAALPALGRLRAEVFRVWPYLYETEPGYEEGYRRTYEASVAAGLVMAWAGEEAVGAATCLPLADETAEVRLPFERAGLDPVDYFYFGESVLRAAWRGQGVGVRFFETREAHARAVSAARFACFCAVERAQDDPRRPDGAGSLAPFWRKRGYAPAPALRCTMRWRDVGDAGATEKTMAFWTRAL